MNKFVELITSDIDGISSPNVHSPQRGPPGLIDGVQSPDMIVRHFRNTLRYIQARTSSAGADVRWEEVNIIGALLEAGLAEDNAR